MQELKLGFLASHGGSNMQAIIDNINSGRLKSKACCVISNNSSSMALERARKENIPAYHISGKTHQGEGEESRAIIEALQENDVNTVILAGYMKKLSFEVIEAFKGRVLNIHPALLPKYGGKGMYGMFVHQAVINAKEKESGASIHIVDSKFDHGRVLAQMKVPVLDDDTPEDLASRILKIEHLLYTDTLIKITQGEIEF